MSELRKDPISDRWVVIAAERRRRPSDFIEAGGARGHEEKKLCPLCEGQEDKTPPEIGVGTWRKPGTHPNTPGWSVRVVPNKFPALGIEGEVDRRGRGIYDMMQGVGAHEVIVETPSHEIHLTEMEEIQIDKVLWSYKERIRDLQKDRRFRYVLVFKNYGEAAGASLSHPHSQLIATPITPRYVKMELTNSRNYFLEKERCIFCDLMRQEIGEDIRLINETEYFITLAPFASRFPFETWLLPRRHASSFADITDEERVQLAWVFKDIITRLKKTLNDPPYNLVVHTAPNILPRPGKPDYWGTIQFDYHWHIEIIPRLTKMAGFEWGSGLYINPTPPEEAAKYLKEIK